MKSHETQHINVSVAKPTPKKEYNRVTCDMCGVLLFENNLKQHILTEHTHETHKCDLCDYTANTKLKVRICWVDEHQNEVIKFLSLVKDLKMDFSNILFRFLQMLHRATLCKMSCYGPWGGSKPLIWSPSC